MEKGPGDIKLPMTEGRWESPGLERKVDIEKERKIPLRSILGSNYTGPTKQMENFRFLFRKTIKIFGLREKWWKQPKQEDEGKSTV